MQPPQQYLARLEDLTVTNNRYVEYSFELVEPNELTFVAGQYVSIKVSEQGERRSYSICNSPDIQHQVQLLVDLEPNGIGSQYLRNLQFGQQVEMLAPMGRFIVPANLSQDELVFVATGSGIAPFRSMIEDQLRLKQTTKKITLFWGMRHPEDLFWLEFWQDLVEAFPNFHFHPVLSQAPDAWTLCRGRVTDCFNVHALPTNAAYFVCGNGQMTQEVIAILTTAKQIPDTAIFTEKFD